MKKLLGNLAVKLGISLLLSKIRDAAEGKLGPEWKLRYWGMAGKKTITGLILAIACAVLEAVGYKDIGLGVGVLAGIAIQAGLLDKAWRNTLPAFLWNSTLYRFLAEHSANVAFVFYAAYFLVSKGYCLNLDCGVLSMVILGIAAAATQIGLLDAAWRAKPPTMWFADDGYAK